MFGRNDNAVERVIKVVLDLGALFLAANLAFDLRYYVDWGGWLEPGPAPWGELYRVLPYMLLGWFLIFATFGLYQPGLKRRQEFALLVKATGAAFLLIFATAFFYRGFSYSRAAAMFMAPIAFLLSVSLRLLFRAAMGQVSRWRTVEERLVVVGRTGETDKLIRRVRRPGSTFSLLGMVVDTPDGLPDGVTHLGAPAELGPIIEEARPDRVLLISGALSHPQLMASVEACLTARVPWAVVPDLYDMLLDRLHLDEVAGVPVMGPRGSNIVGLNRVVKRAADFALAACLLAVLAPVLLLCALAVKLSSRGPALFVQERVGRQGRTFRLYKFRSMYRAPQEAAAQEALPGAHGSSEVESSQQSSSTQEPLDADARLEQADEDARATMRQVIDGGVGELDGAGKPVYKKVEDPRITPVGRFLRRFSLDELPQLLNVLRGDMSLVGPRPAVPWEVEQYQQRHRRRLEAQPGITGLWQVSGRNRLSFDEMVELDIQYIENWSAGLDIRIFVKTIAAVIFSRGY